MTDGSIEDMGADAVWSRLVAAAHGGAAGSTHGAVARRGEVAAARREVDAARDDADRDGGGPGGQELLDRYAELAAAGPRLVIGQLGQSLDGFIASRTGDANYVTGEEDRRHLHRLRALVDAVVVGGSTVLADDCRLTVRSVRGPHPVRVVLDPQARLPRTANVLSDGVAPTLWLVGEGADAARDDGLAPGVAVVPVPLEAGRIAPTRVLELLAARGLGRVLVEGGGRLVSAFFSARLLDRLYLTTAPLLVGDGVPGLRFDGADLLADAVRVPTRRFLLGEDTCTELRLR